MQKKYWLKSLFLLSAMLLIGKIDAQVKFKLELQPDSITYQVSLFSEIGPYSSDAQNFINSSTITIIAPTGQLTPSGIVSQMGSWSDPDTYINPVGNFNMDYFVFNLSGSIDNISFSPGLIVPLFSFTNTVSCAGAVSFMDNDNDPYLNQQPDVNIGNHIAVFGHGLSNAFNGEHEPGNANCMGAPMCNLTIDTVTNTGVGSCGVSDGTITISASNATGTLLYSIDNGLNWLATNIFSGLSAGDYTIKVKDDDCEQTYDNNPVSISEPGISVTLLESTVPSCNVSFDGRIRIAASGGIEPYEYSINNGVNWFTDSVFISLGNGFYNIKARNAGGSCESSYVSNPVAFTIQGIDVVATKVDGACSTDTKGSINITATGGTGSFQYSVDSGATWSGNNAFSELSAGFYNILVSNVNGACQAAYENNPLEIQESPLDFSVTSTNPSCNSAADGTISITLNGATGTFEYSVDSGATWSTSSTINNLAIGDYQVAVRRVGGDCQLFHTNNPIQLSNTPITISVTTINGSCNVANNRIEVAAAGGSGTLEYSSDNGANWQTSNIFTGLTNGTYDVKVRNATGSCETAYSNNPISISTDSLAVTVSSTPPSCASIADGSISITASGATNSVVYSIDNGATFTSQSVFSGLNNGNYSIVVKNADDSCETNYSNNPIQFNTVALAVAVTSNNTSCNSATDGSISMIGNGGSGSYEFSIDSGATWSTSANRLNLAADLYYLQVRNDDGTCTTNYNNNPIEISANSIDLSITSNTPTSCGNSDGSLILSATGGSSSNYEFSIDNGATFSSLGTFQNLSAGTYDLQVRNTGENCIVSYPNNPVTIANSNCDNAMCVAEFTLAETGGVFTIGMIPDTTWNTPLNTVSTAQISIRIPTGGYEIENLQNAISGVVFEEQSRTTSITSSISYDYIGFVLTSNGTTGIPFTKDTQTDLFSFEINGAGSADSIYLVGDGSPFSIPNIGGDNISSQMSVLGWGSADLPVCVSATPKTLCQLAVQAVMTTDATYCGATDGAISIAASCSGDFTKFSIDNGVTYQSSTTFSGLAAGSYQVKLFNDSTNVEVTYSANPVVINDGNSIAFTASSVAPTCVDSTNGEISIGATNGSGSYLYSIDDGQTWSNTATYTGLSVGTFNLKVSNIDTTCTVADTVVSLTAGACMLDSDMDGQLDTEEDLNMNGDLTDDDTDMDGIPNFEDTDDDGDGVSTIMEAAGPNQGDGNGDAISDCLQPNVATIMDANADFRTLEVNGANCAKISKFIIETEAQISEADAVYDFPYDLNSFEIPCPGTVDINLYFHSSIDLSGYIYRKFGPIVPGDMTSEWYNYPVSISEEMIAGQTVGKVAFQLTDGGAGDATGVDSLIVDPGGLAMNNRDTVKVDIIAGLSKEICLKDEIELPNGVGSTTILVQGTNVDASTENTMNMDSCILFTAQSNSVGVEYLMVVFCDAVNTTNCDTTVFEVTISPQTACLVDYFMVESNGVFQFKMVSDTTWNTPANTVASAKYAIRVPSTFDIQNLQSEINSVNFNLQSQVVVGQYTYLTVALQSLATEDIPFVKADTLCLFSFENANSCTDDSLFIVSDGGPIPPLSIGDEIINSQLLVAAWSNTQTVPICGAPEGTAVCSADSTMIDTLIYTLDYNDTAEVCIGSVLQLVDIGTATVLDDGKQVTVSVNDNDDCITLMPPNGFSGADTLTVIHCGAAQATICDTTVVIVNIEGPLPCLFEYILEGNNGVFTVKLAVDSTINSPLNATSSMLVSIRVPRTGFTVSDENITTLISGASFENTSNSVLIDDEETDYGYINFDIGGLFLPTYQSGDTLELFSFTNTGCTGAEVHLVGPGAAFPNPIIGGEELSSYLSIGQFLPIGGTPYCVNSAGVSICEPATKDTLYYTIDFGTNETVCIDSALQLLNSVGNVSICNTLDNVLLGTNNGSTCVELQPTATYSGNDTICVVHCDDIVTDFCDTTIMVITVRPDDSMPPIPSEETYCPVNFDMTLVDGTYIISMTSDTTLINTSFPSPLAPNPFIGAPTTVMDITLRAPTGKLQIVNPINFGTGRAFVLKNSIISPSESPDYDYFTFGLDDDNNPSFEIRYTKGEAIDLFSFQNVNCSLDSIFLVGRGTDFSAPLISGMNVETRIVANADSIPTCVDGTVILPNELSFAHTSADPSSESCMDGSITITAAGGTGLYNYSIDDGVTWSLDNVFSNLEVGVYSMRVRSSDEDCVSAAETVTLSNEDCDNNPPPCLVSISNVAGTDATCGLANGAITITATGPNLEYSMNTGATYQSSNIFENVAAGIYNIVVRDSLMTTCEANVTYTLNGTDGPDIQSVNVSDSTTFANNAGSITIVATGSADLKYSIDGGQNYSTDSSFTDLGSGTYTIMVVYTDDTCPITYDNNPITILAPCFVDAGEDEVICEGEMVNLLAVGGADNYAWTPATGLSATNIANPIATPTETTTYYVTNSDANCTTTDSVTVTVGHSVVDTVIAENTSDCNVSDGSINISATGSNPLIYTIDGGMNWSNSGMFTGLGQGNYMVQVAYSDTTCTSISELVEIASPATPVISLVEHTNPVTCESEDGTIHIEVEDNNDGTFEYSLNGTDWQDTNLFQNLPAGNYTVFVRYQGGTCTIEHTSIITLIPGLGPDISSVVQTDLTALGTLDGSIVINASGIVDLQYSIDNGTTWQVSNEFSGLDTGTYDIKVRYLDESCETPFTDRVVVLGVGNCLSFIDVTPQGPSSCGSLNGAITINVNDPLNVEYSINNGIDWQIGNYFGELNAGEYSVLVRKAGGSCETALDSTITLMDQEEFSIYNVVPTNPDSCNGSRGELFVHTKIFTNIEFSIDNGASWQTENIFSDLTAGTYTVLARSLDLSCEASYMPVVLEEVERTINEVVSMNPTGCDASNGNIFIDSPMGFNTEFSVDNGATWEISNQFDNLSSGTYHIKVRTGSCELEYGQNPVVIGSTTAFSVVNPIPNAATCTDILSGVSITLSDDISSYTVNSGNILNATQSGATLTFDAVVNEIFNEYSLTFTNAQGCQVTESFIVFQATDTEADFVVIEPYCKEMEISLLFTGTATPMANLTWEIDGGVLVDSSPATATTPAGNEITVRWDTEGSRLIKLTVDDGGCIDDEYESIFVRKLPLAEAGPNISICNGACVDLQGSGTGVWFTWSPATGLSTTDGLTTTACPTETTTYYFTVMGVDGCVAVDSVTINVETDFLTTNPDRTICEGETTTLEVNGGTNYVWSPATSLNDPRSATPVASPQTTTIYTVISASASGCMDTANVTVFVNPNPTAIACEDKTICRGDSIQLIVTTHSQYAWSPTNTLINPNSGTPIAFPTETTTYTVTVTDENGCTATDEVVVFVNTPLTVLAGNDLQICAGTSTQLNASGAANYSWSPSNGLSNTNISNPIANPTITTTYTVTGTDVNGCTNTDQVVVAVADDAGIVASADVTICAGAGTNLSATGGANYTWSPSTGLNNPSASNPIANPSVTTTYTVSGTSTSGCPSVDQVTVFVNQIPTPVGCEDKTICRGDSIQLIVTTHSQYAWSPTNTLINPNSGTPIAFPTETTTYTVTVTDENGCTGVDEVVVFVNNPSSVGLGPDMNICGNEPVQLDAGPGIAYQWSPVTGLSDPTIRNPIATVTNTINYSVHVTTDDGCVAQDDITINVNPGPLVNAGPNLTLCSGGTGQLTASGGVSYQWSPATGLSNPNIANPIVTTDIATTYTVTVTDAFGCTATDETLVTISLPISVDAVITNADCCGTLGSAILNVSGGLGNTTYTWTPDVSETNSANNLASGFYEIRVEDAGNCSVNYMLEIKEDCDACANIFTEQERCIPNPGIERVCLPIEMGNISAYEILVGGVNYTPDHGCDFEDLTAYSYALVEGQGNTGPYQIENWDVNGQMHATEVDNLQALTTWMNTIDPNGDWVLNPAALSIIGGNPSSTYGTMKVIQLSKWIETILQPNTTGVATSTIVEVNIPDNRPMEIIVTDTANCCSDTLLLRLCDQLEQPCVEDILSQNIVEESVICGEKTNVCLDIPFNTINNYDFTANGNAYNGEIVPCDYDSMFAYTYFTLPNLGESGPYKISAWEVNGQMNAVVFENVSELVKVMNQIDPTGNWIQDASTLTIIGGNNSTTYGSLVIEQINTGASAILDINSSMIPMGTQFSFDGGNYEFLIINKESGCRDRLVVNIGCEENPTITPVDTTVTPVDTTVTPVDTTITPVDTTVTPVDTTVTPVDTTVTSPNPSETTITVVEDQQLEFCPETDELIGDIISIENLCPETSGTYATVELDTINFCATIEGVFTGQERACFVLCDDNSVCDTIFLMIEVTPKSFVAPITVTDYDTILQTATVTIAVLDNDSINGSVQHLTIITQPSNGQAEINDNNTITYIPRVNYCDDGSPDVFEYELCNDIACSKANVEILVTCPIMTVLSGFSPNDDGVNDYFMIKGIQSFPNNEIQIFNRWGTLVFKQKGYKNQWDGSFNNEKLPDGTYFYLLKDGSGKNYSGFVQIHR